MAANVMMNERMSRCIPIAWITAKRSGISITDKLNPPSLTTWEFRRSKKFVTLLAINTIRKPMIK